VQDAPDRTFQVSRRGNNPASYCERETANAGSAVTDHPIRYLQNLMRRRRVNWRSGSRPYLSSHGRLRSASCSWALTEPAGRPSLPVAISQTHRRIKDDPLRAVTSDPPTSKVHHSGSRDGLWLVAWSEEMTWQARTARSGSRRCPATFRSSPSKRQEDVSFRPADGNLEHVGILMERWVGTPILGGPRP
jgi:hypothetical protein